MSYTFKHLYKRTASGSGSYVFRRYSQTAPVVGTPTKITINNTTSGDLSVTLQFTKEGSGSMRIELLDITETTSYYSTYVSSSGAKTYNLTIPAGQCVIKLTDGTIYFDGQVLGTTANNGYITNVVFGSNYGTVIESNALRGSKINSITLPDNLTTIGSYAFASTRLNYITFPSTLTTIGSYAFNSVGTLGARIDIPRTVTSIGNRAFASCTGLGIVNIYPDSSTNQPSAASQAWFFNCNSSLVLHIPYRVTNASAAYGAYWNYRTSSTTFTYYADLDMVITTYQIMVSVSGGTFSGDSTIITNGSATVILSPNSGYMLPSSVNVTGASYTYDSTTGVISLSNPTQDVIITAQCEMIQTYPINCSVTHGTYTGDSYITSNGTATISIVPSTGYTYPNSVTVTNATYTYNNLTGVITLSDPINIVSITADCPVQSQVQPVTINVDISSTTYSDQYISVTFAKGTGSNTPTYYTTTNPPAMRVYANNTINFTILDTRYRFDTIVVNAISAQYPASRLACTSNNCTTSDSGANRTFTANSNVSSIDLKNTNSGQCRITSITVNIK